MIIYILRMFSWIQNLDNRFRDLIVRHQVSPKVRKALRFYTRLGDGYVWGIVVVALFLLMDMDALWLLVRKALLASGISVLLYWLVKLTVRRPRPYQMLDDVTAEVPPLDQFSFPSGHTMNNLAAGFVVLAMKPSVGWVVVLLPISWGFLRIYFGVHWLSDVVFGLVLGLVAAFLSFQVWSFF